MPEIGVYFANCHEHDKVINENRFQLLEKSQQVMEHDGLNNMNYTVLKLIQNSLFIKVLVKYNNPPSGK